MASLNIYGLFFIFTLLPSVYTIGLERIVGGIETTIANRPYQASLQLLNSGTYSHLCGASILSDTYLLTAAHCYPSNGLSNLYARVGSTAYNSGGQVVKIASFQRHPNYISRILDYDFAILTVQSGQELVLGANVRTITLVGNDPGTVNFPPDGTVVTVSGWGVTSEAADSVPVNLREVNLPLYNFAKCRSLYLDLTRRQICFGGTPQGGTSACFGDSGGPAVQDGIQYALVSGGNSCTSPYTPGIYARISIVRPWIRSLTGV